MKNIFFLFFFVAAITLTVCVKTRDGGLITISVIEF